MRSQAKIDAPIEEGGGDLQEVVPVLYAMAGRNHRRLIRTAPSRPRRCAAAALATLVLAVATLAEPAAVGEMQIGGSQRFLRGMTVSCPRSGEIWGSTLMAESLQALRRLGVEWVAIHPYGAVRRDGSVLFRPAAGEGYLRRAADYTRSHGLRLFWKPHLAYWGSFAWRGEIGFHDEAAWRRFFDGYGDFIVDQARFAQQAEAELFCVGVEYEKTTGRQQEWRRIIRRVRQVYDGSLTYAANWDRLQAVPFWDALDLIGVQAYYPLTEVEDPPRQVLWEAWEGPLGELRALAARYGLPVVLTEIGYNRSPAAARRPWSSRMEDSPASRQLRRRLIEVALERLEGEPVVRGLFWWKWIPGPRGYQRDFSMRDAEAMQALRSHWGDAAEAARPAVTTAE